MEEHICSLIDRMPACLFLLAFFPLLIPITIWRFQATAVQEEMSEKWARVVLQVFWNSMPGWSRENQMSTPWTESWAEVHCYILLLEVSVWITTPAALHGMEDKAEEKWVLGSWVYFKETTEAKVMEQSIQILRRWSLPSSSFHSTAHFISSNNFRLCIYFLL